jgi:hypothetical protein
VLWNTKNARERSIEIGRILGGKLRILLAVQSLNEEVLKNVKRSNIKLSTYEELATHARENDLCTQSDLIVGLPGETLSSLKDNLDILYERGTDKVEMFSLMPIPGTEIYSKETRERFGMRTMHRLSGGCAMEVEGDYIVETEEVVVETDTMTFRDYMTTLQYSALSVFWHHCGIGEPASIYARENGIMESRLFFGMLESSNNRPATIQALDFLEQQACDGLHATPEDVQRAAEQRKVAGLEGLQGTNIEWNFAHYLIKEEIADSLIDDIFDTLERLFREKLGVVPDKVNDLRAFTKAYQKTVDTGVVTWVTDGPKTLTLRRIPERLPNLNPIDASTCSTEEFNRWFYFIRSTRNYVDVSTSG